MKVVTCTFDDYAAPIAEAIKAEFGVAVRVTGTQGSALRWVNAALDGRKLAAAKKLAKQVSGKLDDAKYANYPI